MSFLFGSRSNKTFKPKKNIPEGTHQYDLMRHAAATLGSGNLRLAVMLPEGEDLNEWVAVNTRSVGSGGLLQPDQHAVRHHHGVLHGGVVRGDVGGAQVRVPLGRRTHRQEAHQVLRAQVHRLPHDLGAGPARRRDALPLQNRRAVPQELPGDGQDHPQAPVPRVRAHLPPALPRGGAAGRGGAPQHLLQALHLLRAGIQPDRAAGAGAAAGAHREAHRQGGAMSPPPPTCNPHPPSPLPPTTTRTHAYYCFARSSHYVILGGLYQVSA